MDREDAAYAAGLIGASQVMPIHYNTFPVIQTDVEAFSDDLTSQGIEALIVRPGERVSL